MMEEQLVGMKEMYDVNIRLNSPIEIGNRKYDVNETILSFDKAEIAQLQQQKSIKTARGGYGNRALIDWETDKECTFAITHGLLSLTSWAILSNSRINDKKTKSYYRFSFYFGACGGIPTPKPSVPKTDALCS